jgi:predicted lipid-binding transport protein (Tim44 family)
MSFSDPIDLILLLVLLGIGWRIYTVLGRRDPNSPRNRSEPTPPTNADHIAPESSIAAPSPDDAIASALEGGVASIRKRDKTFDLKLFVFGAERAYELILAAFAQGDRKRLQGLLGPEVMQSFAADIEAREKAGQKQTFSFVSFVETAPLRVEAEGRMARITLRFRSEMIYGLTASDNTVVSGNATSPRVVEDTWTFERDLSSRDPNWILVATADELG